MRPELDLGTVLEVGRLVRCERLPVDDGSVCLDEVHASEAEMHALEAEAEMHASKAEAEVEMHAPKAEAEVEIHASKAEADAEIMSRSRWRMLRVMFQL